MTIDPKNRFTEKISAKESRKLKEKKKGVQRIWAGFAMFGLIGWSVVIPMLAGIILGLWLDKHYHGKYSWTLTFLVLGLSIGCYNAWHWINKENKQIQKEQEEKNG